MLTFSKLGYKGQLGNQLFQIASTIGLAELHKHEYCFPKWKYSEYFQNKLPECTSIRHYNKLGEAFFHYHEWDIYNKDYDLNGWLQSEKYFNAKKTKAIFQFKPDFLESLAKNYAHVFKKKTILIAVRRGDFVNHPFYYQVKFKYYLQAIKHFFPDWRERNLIFTSDDIEYCKKHFSFLRNAYFLESLNDVESMALGTLCDDFIISNSTFSWWIAYLGEKANSKVIRPVKNFRGTFASINSDKDYYPKRWLAFDEEHLKLDAKFYIPNLKSRLFDVKFDIGYYSVKYKYRFMQTIKVFIKQ
jgi:hypothetical protein